MQTRIDEKARGPVRVTLLLLAAPQLAIGVWALFAPRNWHENFPGAGKEWLPLYGPFNEHAVTDIGSTFIAIGLLLVLAAIWLERRVVIAAAVAYLAYQLPHTIYHWGADDRLSSGDQVLNGFALGLAVVAPAAVLFLVRRPAAKASAPREADGSAGRLAPAGGGLFNRLLRSYTRRQYGRELGTVEAFLHHRPLFMGYGAFETAIERTHRVPDKLKALGEMKAAAMVGCEWCMDFGSWLSLQRAGVTEQQLRDLPRYAEADAFSEDEKLVLDYATAMSRTPANVDDELFARLRDRFDDAQIVELTSTIAIENFRGRFNDAVGLDVQGFSEGAVCVRPEMVPGDGAPAERAGTPG